MPCDLKVRNVSSDLTTESLEGLMVKSEPDRPVTRLSLTEEGAKLAERMEETLHNLGDAILQTVPVGEREQVKQSPETVL